MNRLWAPWRKFYIRPEGRAQKGCLFCRLRRTPQNDRHYILKRTEHCFAVLNLYPYTNGHTLICPNRHVASIDVMSRTERLDWLALAEEVRAAIQKAMHPHGFNMGMNFGRVSGAGIPGHLHLHVVPRWQGDTNFMPVLADCKVISESLRSSYAAILESLSDYRSCSSKRRRSRRR